MLTENSIFAIREPEKQLYDSRRCRCGLTPEIIDYEMQFFHSNTELQIHHLTQDGLEHFVSKYGSTYRTLYFYFSSDIRDFSPLADLKGLEAVRIEWCRNTDKLWDMSLNSSLKVISIDCAKRVIANPMQLQTSSTLEEIRFWGGDFDNKHTLESLSCFRGMKSLKRIDLNDIKLKTKNLDILSSLPQIGEFNFDAGMLTTEEIAWICAKYPHIRGDCLGVYTTNEVTCLNDIRICGFRKPGLDLPKDQKRLDKYVAEFNALVEKYRNEP
ncbi:MAG: hypothetical protein J6L81_06605 [Clostridia bacterium]|nr:hypothetical protein [Clostridia bacterium]